MKDSSSIQQSLINIFKVSIKEDVLEELAKTCHIELKKLMIFAQKRERGRHFTDDIAKAINNAVGKASKSAPVRCHISVNIKEKLWPVKIDKEEIDDVLSNNLDNAFVKEYYGSIEVKSEKGKGTVFHIYLPTTSFFS